MAAAGRRRTARRRKSTKAPLSAWCEKETINLLQSAAIRRKITVGQLLDELVLSPLPEKTDP
jgi:hypothetical protein